MAFRASTTSPQQAYATLKAAAVQLKINLVAIESHLATTFVNYDYVRDVYKTLQRANNQIASLVSTPGIAQYAKDQEGDQAYDVVSAVGAVQAVIETALLGIDAQAPATVSLIPPSQWGDSNTMIADVLTAEQTTDLRNVLNLVIAEIA